MLEKLYLNAGQMKAGTTYLYKLMSMHPDIYFSPEKEVHYFSEIYSDFKILNDRNRVKIAKRHLENTFAAELDLPSLQKSLEWAANYTSPIDSERWYENLFCGVQSDQYVADFSNLTCCVEPHAMQDIKKAAKEVKVTYCTRHPVDRAISHMKFHLKFAGKDFSIADKTESEIAELFYSRDIRPQGFTFKHLNSLEKVFGESLGIVRCENMWKDPARTYHRVASFLHLPESPFPSNSDVGPINVGPRVEGLNAVRALVAEFLEDEIKNHERLEEEFSNRIII